ncbi:hypothetical protein [Siphonobacter sp. SORGH_AS_1065]|uniref:hypothetical protein n=1 Tax=Siphonobacter sp. SORGH_AS_1065 TaxID=3041795 RepID=UPI002786BA5B|nr:hypothetical protein [Siphonobacter sp. SORGH_AS_1065]MDQ1086228.1 hypothetical protein [Siphonobacter sp. SORGH_AS_1065]
MTDLIKFLLIFNWIVLFYTAWQYQGRNRNIYFSLLALFGAIFITRSANLLHNEPNVDTSTWLNSTLTIGKASETLWTWLNYTDGRPFTVAPLWLGSLLGMPISYMSAELIGIFLWCITLYFLAQTLQVLGWRSERVYVLILALAGFIGTTSYGDHVGYNSEVASMWMLALAVWMCLRWLNQPTPWIALFLGTTLGLLPYAKFQNAPMGIVIAAFAGISWIQRKNWQVVLLLLLGGLLPSLGFVLYYSSLGQLETFWNHYFLYYFYYSYTDEFSKLTTAQRFSPIRFLQLSLTHYSMRWLAAGLFTAVGLLLLHFFRKTKTALDWLALALLLTTYYAILQSGNNFHHYALYVPYFFTLVIGIWGRDLEKSLLQKLTLLLILFGGVQAVWNLWYRTPLPPPDHDELAHEVAQIIKQNSDPDDRMVLWGWADRVYVYAERPMGHRYPYTIGIFYPSPLHDARVVDFLKDMEENKPRIFVDVCGTSLTYFGSEKERHEATPEIGTYIQQHYELLKQTENVRIYKRMR